MRYVPTPFLLLLLSDFSIRSHCIRQDGEAIEVLALPLDNAEAFLMDAALPKSAGMMFGVAWLLLERCQGRTRPAAGPSSA